MKLLDLINADIHRDGGSYEATFTTDDGLGYGLWLQCSRRPDNEGLHHRWLFEYRGFERPEGCIPVVTGSDAEQQLIRRIDEYLKRESPPGSHENPDMRSINRLHEMLHYIIHRETCFPSDLRAAGFIK